MTAQDGYESIIDWRVLGQLVREISTGRPIDDILRRNLPFIAEAVSADIVSVFQLDEASAALMPIAACGVEHLMPFPVPAGQELVSSMGPDGCALFMHDARLLGSDSPEIHGADLPTMARCIPLIFQGTGLGAITFARVNQAEAFDREALSLMFSISAQISLAMGICAPCGDVLSRERAERALQFAHTLQTTFSLSAVPTVPGVSLSARRVSSLEMGGDLYDILELPRDRVALVIGSTSGVGVEAGLRAARTAYDLRGLLASGFGAGEALFHLNDLVIRHARGKCLVNLFIAILDRTTGEFACSAAGSANVYLLKEPGGAPDMLDVVSGNPVGLLSGWHFRESQFTLPVGGALVIHTDGMLHNAFEAGAAFDVSDIASAINGALESGHPIADSIIDALRNRTSWQLGSEDVTVLAVRRDA